MSQFVKSEDIQRIYEKFESQISVIFNFLVKQKANALENIIGKQELSKFGLMLKIVPELVAHNEMKRILCDMSKQQTGLDYPVFLSNNKQ